MQACNAVFEGGGIRGIGFAGAITAMEAGGYKFLNAAGSSAGAIAAALVTAGYTGEEIKAELINVDYTKFKEKCIFGDAVNLIVNYGVYKTNYFEKWLNELLKKKGVMVFGDLHGRLKVTASDLTERKILVLPDDLANFGLNPEMFSVAVAVKMSMSIPFYFESYKLTDSEGGVHVIVDGGLLSNYPVWILDSGEQPRITPSIPTFGFKFNNSGITDEFSETMNIRNIIDYSKAVVSTLLMANDNYHISVSKGDLQRSIIIPTAIQGKKGAVKYINATDFNIKREESDLLYSNGYHAASNFLKTWNFNEWKKTYRA